LPKQCEPETSEETFIIDQVHKITNKSIKDQGYKILIERHEVREVLRAAKEFKTMVFEYNICHKTEMDKLKLELEKEVKESELYVDK